MHLLWYLEQALRSLPDLRSGGTVEISFIRRSRFSCIWRNEVNMNRVETETADQSEER